MSTPAAAPAAAAAAAAVPATAAATAATTIAIATSTPNAAHGRPFAVRSSEAGNAAKQQSTVTALPTTRYPFSRPAPPCIAGC